MKNTKALALQIYVGILLVFNVSTLRALDTLILQNGLNEYSGCEDVHFGNGDENVLPAMTGVSDHPSLYLESFVG